VNWACAVPCHPNPVQLIIDTVSFHERAGRIRELAVGPVMQQESRSGASASDDVAVVVDSLSLRTSAPPASRYCPVKGRYLDSTGAACNERLVVRSHEQDLRFPSLQIKVVLLFAQVAPVVLG